LFSPYQLVSRSQVEAVACDADPAAAAVASRAEAIAALNQYREDCTNAVGGEEWSMRVMVMSRRAN